MPEYLYKNPKTGEVISVIQRMVEPHFFEKDGVRYERVFTVPLGATDSIIDPFSPRDFVEKMGRKKCRLGDMYDEAAAASAKREQKLGIDPVKEKYLQNWSTKRKNRRHPSLSKDVTIEVAI